MSASEIGGWAVGIVIGVFFASAYFMARKEEKVCPECGSELLDVGFDGWKKRCTNDKCNWRNHGR